MHYFKNEIDKIVAIVIPTGQCNALLDFAVSVWNLLGSYACWYLIIQRLRRTLIVFTKLQAEVDDERVAASTKSLLLFLLS